MSKLKISNFTVYRDSFRVGPIDLTADEGCKVLVYGPNGSGKTTLLLGMLGILKTSGSLSIDGEEISSLPVERRKIAYQPASPTAVPKLTVRKILRLASPRIDQDIINELKIDSLLDRTGDELSAGQARLVQLAAVFMGKARVILLDEPFSFLSQEHREMVYELIRKERRIVIATAQERDERFDLFVSLARSQEG